MTRATDECWIIVHFHLHQGRHWKMCKNVREGQHRHVKGPTEIEAILPLWNDGNRHKFEVINGPLHPWSIQRSPHFRKPRATNQKFSHPKYSHTTNPKPITLSDSQTHMQTHSCDPTLSISSTLCKKPIGRSPTRLLKLEIENLRRCVTLEPQRELEDAKN